MFPLFPYLYFSAPSDFKYYLKAFSVLPCPSLSKLFLCFIRPGADSSSTSSADSEQCASVRAPHWWHLPREDHLQTQSKVAISSTLQSLWVDFISFNSMRVCERFAYRLWTGLPKSLNTVQERLHRRISSKTGSKCLHCYNIFVIFMTSSSKYLLL